MSGATIQNWFDRPHLTRLADWLAVAIAVALPWSTSAVAILVVLWLLTLVPTLRWVDVCRELATPAGGLPVLLVALGALGIVWADVSLLERWKGLDSFCKLLVIPLLLLQFRRSDRGLWVFGGYLASCAVLLLCTTIVLAIPQLSTSLLRFGNVLVKNVATQSGEFVTCIFGMLFLAIVAFEQRRWWRMAGFLVVVFGMLGNIFFFSTGRTALVVVPVLLVILAIKRLNVRGMVIVFAGAATLVVAAWFSSPYLRARTMEIYTDIQKYQAKNDINSSSERIEFWTKSVGFVAEAPILGHGTGTIPSLFAKATAGLTGAAGSATTNPHNQTFAVAIQIGLIGALALWAMWVAHLLLFRGEGLPEWVGLVVVVQNIVGSLFNSHLFDFGQGWVYVVGVGVAGGMALKNRSTQI